MKPPTPPADQTAKAGTPRRNPFGAAGRAARTAGARLRASCAGAYGRAKKKGRAHWSKWLTHWVGVAAVIWAGIYVGGLMERHEIWLRERYRVTQAMHDLARWLSGRTPYDKHTTVVLIGDEEFWGPELARRSPLNRFYLARLIKSLDRFNPRVIALDVHLSAPTPDGPPAEYPDYERETKALLDAIKDVGSRRSVVLLRSIGFKGGYYVYESDVYDEDTFVDTNVSVGHVVFEHDYRRIPLSLVLQDGTQIDSFSEAIARAYDMSGTALDFDEGEDESVTYGEYLGPGKINEYAATRVLCAPDGSQEFAEIAAKLAGKVVIIGGSWHQHSLGRGPKVDERSTPVGDIPGVFMHANYVEALLDTRYYQPLPKSVLLILEVLLGLATAVLIAREFWWVWKLLAVAGLILILMILAIISLQILGAFFDFFVPVIMVIGHAVFEQVSDWRKAAKRCARTHHAP